MGNVTTIDGWTLTHINTITGFQNGLCAFELDEVQDFDLENTEDTKEIKGGDGILLNNIKTNKHVKGTGTNGLLSAGLMATQTGSLETTTDGKVKFKDSVDITAIQATSHSIILSQTPIGTAGAEIGYLWVKTSSGAVTKLTQATTASAGKFSVSGTIVTFAEGAITSGDLVYGWYDINLVDGTFAQINNETNKFSGSAEIFVSGLAINPCDEEAEFQIHIPRASFSGNFNIAYGDSQTVHKFEFNSMKNKCTALKYFWNFKVFSLDET